MNLDFSEIQEIQKIISVPEFENLFHTVENKAFELRGRSTDFYTYLNEFFEKENINESIKVMLLKYLTTYKGNWKHDFLTGLYESLKELEPNQENKFNINDTDFELAKSLIALKVKELDVFNYDVYNIEDKEVTRLIYETQKIIEYLNKQGFKDKFRNVYLVMLKTEIKNNNIDIRDGSYHNWQSITNDFLIWIDKELINIKLKERNEITSAKNTHPFYCEIGVLFAKDLIQFRNQKYYYCDNSFVSIAKLSKHIQDNVLNTNKAVRQYVNDTLFRTGAKNFYNSFTMMNNIVAYCQENNIETTANFQNIYTQLKNLH